MSSFNKKCSIGSYWIIKFTQMCFLNNLFFLGDFIITNFFLKNKCKSFSEELDFNFFSISWGTLIECRRVVEGGGRYPCAPLDKHPLEPEAGSNLLNSKLAYILRFFTFLINRQCHNLSILWLFLKLFLVP